MHDFSAALVDAPAASLPSFVAFKLSQIPAIDSSHIDVCTISQQIRELELKVSDNKSHDLWKHDL